MWRPIAFFILLAVLLVYIWAIAFGPLYDEVAYPGDLIPRAMPTSQGFYIVIDCQHERIFYGTRAVGMHPETFLNICKEN